MNDKKHIGIIISISLTTIALVLSAVAFVPGLNNATVEVLTSLNSNSRNLLPAAAILGNATQAKSPTTSLTSSTTIATSDTPSCDGGATTTPKRHEYRLERIVDSCTMNTLSSQGFEPVQYGTNVDVSSGRDSTCTKLGIVNVIDWVIFSREK